MPDRSPPSGPPPLAPTRVFRAPRVLRAPRPPLAALAGLAAVASWQPAHAQLIVSNDGADARVWHVDLTGFTPPRALATAAAGALTADPASRRLYWTVGNGINTGTTLVRADFLSNSIFQPVPIVTTIGPIQAGGAPSSLFTGLAFDTAATRLYAYRNTGSAGTEGFYEINPATAAATLVWPASSTAIDFGAFEYDSVADAFYACNDGSTGLPAGRGIYRIDKPLNAPTLTFVAPYPAGDADIDGLAINAGKLYLVNDAPAQGIYVFDLATNAYETPLTSPLRSGGSFAGGAMLSGLIAADISVRVSGPADCGIGLGQTVELRVDVLGGSLDAAASTRCAITLPAGFQFADSTPPLTPIGRQMEWALGRLDPGSTSTLTIRGTFSLAGTEELAASVSTATQELALANNTATDTFLIAAAPAPTTASIVAVLSTVATSTSSRPADPAISAARFSSGRRDLGIPFASPTGRFWLISAAISTDAFDDDILLRGQLLPGTPDGRSTITMVAREGITQLPAGRTVRAPLSDVYSINDAGDFVFAEDTSTSGVTDWTVQRSVAGVFRTIARRAEAAIGFPSGVTYGQSIRDPRIAPSGDISFTTRLSGTNITSANDEVALTAVALGPPAVATLVARESVTVPTNQSASATSPLAGILRTSGNVRNAAAGGATLVSGILSTAPTGSQRVIVRDDRVILQAGRPVDGSSFIAPIGGPNPGDDPFAFADLAPDGRAVVIGSNTDGQHWVWIAGQVHSVAGDPVLACPPCVGCPVPVWRTGGGVGGGNSFSLASSNIRGETLVAGRIDAADPLASEVLVLNRSLILARSNDPVDLDANGLFDDDAFIRTFDSRGFLASGYALVVVSLRNARSAVCREPDAPIGQALLRFAIPCVADLDDGSSSGTRDGGISIDDLLYFLTAFDLGSTIADVDDGSDSGRRDCGVGVEDLLYFLRRYEEGC